MLGKVTVMSDIQSMLDKIPVEDLHSLIIDLRKRLDEKNNVIRGLYEKIKSIQEIFVKLTKNDEIIYESMKELEMIFNASDDYIVILDDEHKIKRANALFCKLVKLPVEKVIGTKFSTYFSYDLDDNMKLDLITVPSDKFIETVFYSTVFQKTFLVRSRKLKDDHYPLVYLHITKDISRIIKENEC